MTYESEQMKQSKFRKLQVGQNSCEWHMQGQGQQWLNHEVLNSKGSICQLYSKYRGGTEVFQQWSNH